MRSLKSLFVLTILLAASSLKAQFKSGEMLAGASMGFVPQITGTVTLPPIGIMGEYALTENLIGGIYVGYTSSESSSPVYDLRWRDNLYIIGVRGSYNFELSKNFDVYGGLFYGYTIASSVLIEGRWPVNLDVLGLNIGQTRLAGFVGARYLIDNRFGFFGEFGYGISIMSAGVVVNLGRHELPFL